MKIPSPRVHPTTAKSGRRERRKHRRALAIAASFTMISSLSLTACSGDEQTDSTAASVSQPAASFPGKAATGTPIRIGLINPEGGQALSSPEYRETAEAAAKYANAQLGGIGGHPIELVPCRNGEDPVSARDCANRMVESKVSAVVVTSTGLGDVIVPIVTAAGIPYVSTAGQSTQELTTDGVYLWTGGFPASLHAMATHAKSEHIKHVTAFSVDVPAAVNGLRALGSAYFSQAGVDLKIVPIPLGTPDATPQISAGIADKPEGVVVVGDATSCTASFKALGTVGYTGDKMAIQSCVTPDVIAAVGPSINNTSIFTAAQTTGDNPEAVLYRSVVAQYSPHTDISGYAYVGYQGVLGLVRATAGISGSDTSPAAIAAALKAARNVPTPAGGGLTFTCDGSANPALKAVCGKGSIVATLKDGNLVDPQVVD
ncbi:MAG: ABC transporter substrate-binding protein [Gordonia sp. (in: high G+C Gram-positive bacteria)]